VSDALARFHGLQGVPSEPDAADAVAVALCHLTQSRLRRRMAT
jgi:Holliday junction resolvasome RuvABC endonuclease subunit